jgi:hypothetical protein
MRRIVILESLVLRLYGLWDGPEYTSKAPRIYLHRGTQGVFLREFNSESSIIQFQYKYNDSRDSYTLDFQTPINNKEFRFIKNQNNETY